ncbi:MAG: pknK [Cyanobacteria bacterium RYN_339]|nr:pknK [Cyanobacteria bacterium RYN_339]
MRSFRPLLGTTLALVTLAGCGTTLVPGAARKAVANLAAKADDAWQSYPDQPAARNRAAAVPIGFSLFIVGGDGGEQGMQVFHAFDKWTSAPALPTGRKGLSAVMVPASRVLAVGGKANGHEVGTAELFSTDKGSWSTLAPMPTARANAGADADGVFAYVAGGCAAEKPLATVERLDIRDGKWAALPNLGLAREGCVAVRLGRRMVVIGGKTASGAMTGAVERYNLEDGGAWAAGASMPTPRAFAGVAVYGHHAFLLGGLGNNNQELDVVESYDMSTDTWTKRAPLPQALVGGLGAKLGERMVVTGGSAAGKSNTHTWGRPFPFPAN